MKPIRSTSSWRIRRAWAVGKDGRILVLRRVSAPPDLKILVTPNISVELRAGAR